MLNLDVLANFLEDKGFQSPETGQLFFPAYIYCYPPEQEYLFREELDKMLLRLKRPNHYLDCLKLDLFELLTQYLKDTAFGGQSLFDLLVKREKEDPDEALGWIADEANSIQFYKYIEQIIDNHFGTYNNNKRVYLLVCGVGNVYPYLRASSFLKNTEHLIKRFKIILFYPGAYSLSNYCLFGHLNHENIYRANLLNDLIPFST
ncbi:DUF1788 domain-containing protein [Sphingobacteriales bacterium UPWRP_1]|nr:hypothetical protein BVG80_10195 [Sphingobacteriales bacterium TSM_CSM]PSJ73786.1 DUF1788 domain-containing protein [Sphingobacteriales bacterium UPWRP_1]